MALPQPSHEADNLHEDATAHEHDDRRYAPWLQLPSESIKVVEHPCIIKNIDKGIKSLGGRVRLSETLTSDDQGSSLSLSLRPDDPLAKKLKSASIKTKNLLLKVTVPKRTGRKRKRGSDGPFLSEAEIEAQSNGPFNATNPSAPSSPYVAAEVVFRSLQDNVSRYSVRPVGCIEQAYRFRGLPDGQYAASRDRISRDIREHLFPLNLKAMKTYPLDTAPGIKLDPNIGPPAQFWQSSIPFPYSYRQNPFIKYAIDVEGQSHVINMSRRIASDALWVIKLNVDFVPTAPKAHVPPEDHLSQYTQDMIVAVRAELDQRPIITRHVLYNRLGWDRRDKIREAVVYCGFFFDSGPFKDALIKWGVDPRSDSAFRRYQTISYISFKRERRKDPSNAKAMSQLDPEIVKKGHIFDGLRVSPTGNMYQVCDITDATIRQILDTEDIRSTCSPNGHGWYHAGTWAKARVVMRDKVDTNVQGRTPDNSVYRGLLNLPDFIGDIRSSLATPEEIKQRREGVIAPHELNLMKEVRIMVRQPGFVGIKNPLRTAKQNRDAMWDGQDEDMDVGVPPARVEDLDWEESEGFFDSTGNEDTDADAEGEVDDDQNAEDDEGQWPASAGQGTQKNDGYDHMETE